MRSRANSDIADHEVAQLSGGDGDGRCAPRQSTAMALAIVGAVLVAAGFFVTHPALATRGGLGALGRELARDNLATGNLARAVTSIDPLAPYAALVLALTLAFLALALLYRLARFTERRIQPASAFAVAPALVLILALLGHVIASLAARGSDSSFTMSLLSMTPLALLGITILCVTPWRRAPHRSLKVRVAMTTALIVAALLVIGAGIGDAGLAVLGGRPVFPEPWFAIFVAYESRVAPWSAVLLLITAYLAALAIESARPSVAPSPPDLGRIVGSALLLAPAYALAFAPSQPFRALALSLALALFAAARQTPARRALLPPLVLIAIVLVVSRAP